MIARASPAIPRRGRVGGRDQLWVLRRWGLLAVVVVAAMVPWYTLRLFPLATFGTAKVNLLDVLAGAAVLAALPSIIAVVRDRNGPVLSVLAFMAYLLIPFAIGLRDPEAAPHAIREFRALAFYALAPAFAAEAFSSSEFRAFPKAFVAGACVAIAAVFVHLRWLVGLPGYTHDTLLAPAGFVVQSLSWNEHVPVAPTIPIAAGLGYRADYLEWTVPFAAFALSVGGLLLAPARRERLLWAVPVVATSWYLLASAARSPQVVALGAAVALCSVRWRGSRRGRQMLTAGTALVILLAGAAAMGLRAPAGVQSVAGPADTTLRRWSEVFTDASLRLRAKEIKVSLPVFVRHPIIGEGLGGAIPIPEFAVQGQVPRVIASGYGFLLVKTGLAGLLLYALMVGNILRFGWRRIRNGAGLAPAALIGVVGITALMILNLVHPIVDIPEGVIAFSLFFGMIMTAAPGAAGGAWRARRDG